MKIIQSVIILCSLIASTRPVEAQRMLDQIIGEPPAILEAPMSGDHNPNAKIVADGLFSQSRPYYELYSAASHQFLGTKEGNLYVREEQSDEFEKILEPKEGWYWHIENAQWSPNGKHIIAKQINDSQVPRIKLTHKDSTEITHKPYSRAGENIPIHQFYIINVATLETVAVEQNPDHAYVHVMDWRADNSGVFLIEADRLMKSMELRFIDANTGGSNLILTETSDTYLIGLNLLQGNSQWLIDQGVVTFLHDRDQFIWLSERTGYYQLYLYDFSGTLLRPLTTMEENGIIDFLVDVDLKHDWLYFSAHADRTKPYARQVYRTGLKQEKIESLISEPDIFDVFLSENKDSLWTLRSSLEPIMQLDAYSSDGKFLGTPWKGDLSSISNGYFNIEYPSVVASDNQTKLQALIMKPRDFDPEKEYPVVEYIYGGNFVNVVIRDLFSPELWDMQELANDGFIVVFIDGRATPQRGEQFRDFSYGQFGQVELQDHVSVMKQLGNQRPYMDMGRIGIIGHSWGGHFALRALLEAPEFYKAGHINAAGVDPLNFRVSIEAFMGCLPQDCPENYEKSNITNKLENLSAPLMIVHGTADDDVPIDEAYKLIELLDKLNYTNYQFIPYQGMGHIVMRNRQWRPTMIDFFLENLH